MKWRGKGGRNTTQLNITHPSKQPPKNVEKKMNGERIKKGRRRLRQRLSGGRAAAEQRLIYIFNCTAKRDKKEFPIYIYMNIYVIAKLLLLDWPWAKLA